MAELHVMPGVERRDLLGVLPAEQLLQKAIDAGITDAIVIGRDREGRPYIATCMSDVDRAVGRIMHAATYLASCTIENDQVIDTDDGSAI